MVFSSLVIGGWAAICFCLGVRYGWQRRDREARLFKVYVHKRLDAMGVPEDPYPPITQTTGCRVGSRLSFVENELERGGHL